MSTGLITRPASRPSITRGVTYWPHLVSADSLLFCLLTVILKPLTISDIRLRTVLAHEGGETADSHTNLCDQTLGHKR
jgi:hypothetical protein